MSIESLFRSAGSGQAALNESQGLQFLVSIQRILAVQPPLTDLQLRNAFQSMQVNSFLTLKAFTPVYQSWIKKTLEVPETEVLKPSPLSAFYSHPTNKSYEVRVAVGDVRYIKISFSNPDNQAKTLRVQSEDENLISVRKAEINLEPRNGFDYIRLKLIGKPRPCTIETRIALIRSDSGEVEEVLQFKVITSEQAPRPSAELLVPQSSPLSPSTS